MRRPPNIVLAIVFFVVGALGGRAFRSRAPSSADTTQAKERPAAAQANPALSSDTKAPSEPVVRLKQIASATNANKRARLVAEIADDLDPEQIREVLAELERTHVRERQEITVRLVSRWAKLDPKAAIDFTKSIDSGYQRDEVLGAAVKGWMEVDAAAARDWVLALKGTAKDAALRGLISATAESDPRAACAFVQQIRQRYDGELAEDLFDSWTKRNPREAAENISQLPKGFLREQAANVVAERWAASDLSGALAWAEGVWDQKISRVEGRTFPSGSDALTTVLQKWINQDRESALAWINSLTDEKKRGEIMGTLVAVEGDRNPDQTARWVLEGVEPGKLQDTLIEDLVWRWSDNDSNGALNWGVQLTEKRLQELVLPRLAYHTSAENAPLLIELAEKVGGAQKASTVDRALRAWAGGDPNAAAAWLESQPPNHRSYYTVAYSWARNDPKAATEWINRLPAGTWKDDAIRNVVVDIEPSLGAQWINAIADEAKREETCVNLAKTWLKRDTNAARAWLANAPLSQQKRNELLGTDAK